MATKKEIHSVVLRLPTRERAELAQALLLSLEEDSDNDVQAAWALEIAHRYQQYKSGLVQPIDSTQVMMQARQAFNPDDA